MCWMHRSADCIVMKASGIRGIGGGRNRWRTASDSESYSLCPVIRKPEKRDGIEKKRVK